MTIPSDGWDQPERLTACPRCKGTFYGTPSFCPHCGVSKAELTKPAIAPGMRLCPHCQKQTPENRVACVNCMRRVVPLPPDTRGYWQRPKPYLALAGVAFLIFVLYLGSVSDGSSSSDRPRRLSRYHVNFATAGGCDGSYGTATASGTIRNRDTTPHDFHISVEYRSPSGVREGDGVAIVRSLAAGDTATWEAYLGSGVTGGGRCRLLGVEVR